MGWYRKFLKRHKLSMRRKTTAKLKTTESNEVINDFIKKFRTLFNSGIFLRFT